MAMASALRVVLQIAVLPIIGRLLGPHAYGEVALVTPFVFFAMLLAESGLGACIVRADKVTHALEGTVFCFSIILSLFFIALSAALAFPLGRFLNEPEFPGLLMGMSSILLLASFNIVPASLLLRNKRYHWIAISDVASSAGGLIGVILGISLGWGVWSLVAQQIGLWTFKLIVVSAGARIWPRLIFHWSALKENFRFGSHLTGSSIVWFFSRNVDNVLIGKLMGSVVLGYYALAFQIVCIPQMILAGSVYYTVFSGTSEAVRQGISPAPQVLSLLKGVMLICAPAVAGLSATAGLSVPLVVGDKWAPVSTLIILLAPFGFSQALSPLVTGTMNGLGKSSLQLRLGSICAILTIIAIAIGAFFGSNAVAIGVSFSAMLYPVMATVALVHMGQFEYKPIFQALWAPLTTSAIMGTAIFFLAKFVAPLLPLSIALAACIISGIILYIMLLLILFRDHLSADIAVIKKIMLRKQAKA